MVLLPAPSGPTRATVSRGRANGHPPCAMSEMPEYCAVTRRVRRIGETWTPTPPIPGTDPASGGRNDDSSVLVRATSPPTSPPAYASRGRARHAHRSGPVVVPQHLACGLHVGPGATPLHAPRRVGEAHGPSRARARQGPFHLREAAGQLRRVGVERGLDGNGPSRSSRPGCSAHRAASSLPRGGPPVGTVRERARRRSRCIRRRRRWDGDRQTRRAGRR